MTVVQLLRDAAVQSPNAVAIDGDGRRATYAELGGASSRVANALIALGVRRGDRVGFLDRNATEYWETFIGAMKAGAVFVPLNFRLSSDEVAWALDDAGASVVVAGAGYGDLISPSDRPLVVIGASNETTDSGLDFDRWLTEASIDDPALDAVGAELIELVYSSGTTGRPKGVMVTDEQLEWAIESFSSSFNLDNGSRSLVPIPYYHVFGGGWGLASLAKGGLIVQSRDPSVESILQQLVDYRVTHMATVPAILQLLVQSSGAKAVDLSALRRVVYGGSPVSEPLLRASIETLDAEFYQAYALSEAMGVTLLRPDQHRLHGDLSKLGSAGTAMPGVEIKVLDVGTGNAVAKGDVGEIVVRAPSVTPGYWRRPEATAEAFTSDGFLRTGDLGAFDDAGYLYLRDRIKDMIITGGENVYPTEVETVLAGHPAVLDVAVVGVPSAKWGETPMAFVVPRPGEDDAEDIIEFTRARLAHYKCPTAVTFVKQLPRNPSGKVLKRELRLPYWNVEDREPS